MKRRNFLPAAAAAFVLALAGATPASADSINVDQSQTVTNYEVGRFAIGMITQSFVPTVSNIRGFSVFLGRDFLGAATGDLDYYLLDQLSFNNVVTFGRRFARPLAWTDVYFPTPVQITPGKTYYLVLQGPRDATLLGAFEGYANGQVYFGDKFTPAFAGDIAFRTYTVTTPPSAVPEGSAGLVTAALLLLPLLTKSRRMCKP
ncbi:hypothetical protein F183_A15850 [Bryobacterales bacterium F-183]|nr:hypothetical protein F183_A15850 [Bryobacterales bacterium F-183]